MDDPQNLPVTGDISWPGCLEALTRVAPLSDSLGVSSALSCFLVTIVLTLLDSGIPSVTARE